MAENVSTLTMDSVAIVRPVTSTSYAGPTSMSVLVIPVCGEHAKMELTDLTVYVSLDLRVIFVTDR